MTQVFYTNTVSIIYALHSVIALKMSLPLMKVQRYIVIYNIIN